MVASEGILVERDGDWIVTRWRGEIDISNATLIEEHSIAAVRNTDRGVIVDLSDASYIDSAGIRSVVSILRLLQERRQKLLLVVPSSSTLRRVLDIAGVPGLVPTFVSIEEAKAAR